MHSSWKLDDCLFLLAGWLTCPTLWLGAMAAHV